MHLECQLEGKRGSFSLFASLNIESDAIALFGPSGAGKSTLIRAFCGLWKAESGRLCIDGRVMHDSSTGIWVPAEQRRIGVLFQEPLLFPHLDVRKNVAFGASDEKAVDEAICLMELGSLEDRYPKYLSGGEAQRVALARALAVRPKLLLLDEPFTGMDGQRRNVLVPHLRQLRSSGGVPMIFVSHHIKDVADLADRVVPVTDGKAEKALPVGEFLQAKGAQDDR